MAIVAAAVLGGFLPHGVLSGADGSVTQVVRAVEGPVSVPVGCADATCGKGSPAPGAPSPGIVLMAVVAGALGVAAAAAFIRRRQVQALALPAGIRDPLFHPPQFS